jgi:ClpP class serine protease
MNRSIQPVLLAPGFAGDFPRALKARESGPNMGKPAAKKLRAIGRDEAGGRYFDMVGNIAVISVSGMLVDKFPYIGWPWITGYDALRYQLSAAFADPEVRGIVLDIDSGGGMVAGCFDFVDWMYEARQASDKPLVSILTEYAYSAAYAIASNTESISVPRTGGLGSIGVLMLHLDWSKALEEWGVTPTFIYSGAHKVDGNPYEPLPASVKAQLEAECDDLRDLFAATVARGRNISAESILKTEAQCFDGPAQLAQALKLGLADAIAAPDQAFAAFQQAIAA